MTSAVSVSRPDGDTLQPVAVAAAPRQAPGRRQAPPAGVAITIVFISLQNQSISAMQIIPSCAKKLPVVVSLVSCAIH